MRLDKKHLIILLLATIIFSAITSTFFVKAYEILDSATCYGYRADTYSPKGRGSAYFTHNEKVGFWVKIANPPSDLEMRVIWIDPDGDQFDSNAVEAKDMEGENWGIIFDPINIANAIPENKPGKWRVELSIDHNVELAREFNIINYEEFTSSIDDIKDQIDEIITENNNLENELQILTARYTALQANYTRLQAQTGPSSEYQELQDDYEQLDDDYRDLQVTLSTTRMMMYGAVVVAIASVAVAVYFGTIKK
jgi:hypothetical protein